MNDKPEIGTVVYLKSGSPALTVSDQEHHVNGLVCVEWFVDGAVQRDAFHRDCLTATKPQILDVAA